LTRVKVVGSFWGTVLDAEGQHVVNFATYTCIR